MKNCGSRYGFKAIKHLTKNSDADIYLFIFIITHFKDAVYTVLQLHYLECLQKFTFNLLNDILEDKIFSLLFSLLQSSDNADVFTPELLQEDDEEKRKNTYRY